MFNVLLNKSFPSSLVQGCEPVTLATLGIMYLVIMGLYNF